MKLFHYSGNCHLNKVQRTSAHQSISLIVFLLATILILPSFASAEIKKEYYPSGKLKSEENIINANIEGLFKQYFKRYYKNGQLESEANYEDGKEEGLSKGFHKNGKLLYEVNYKNGKREGLEKTYHESGTMSYMGNYKKW